MLGGHAHVLGGAEGGCGCLCCRWFGGGFGCGGHVLSALIRLSHVCFEGQDVSRRSAQKEGDKAKKATAVADDSAGLAQAPGIDLHGYGFGEDFEQDESAAFGVRRLEDRLDAGERAVGDDHRIAAVEHGFGR